MFVLTVEPPGDTDPARSDQELLGGAIADGAVTLTSLGFVSADPMADFSASPGTHVLLTPTTTTTTPVSGSSIRPHRGMHRPPR